MSTELLFTVVIIALVAVNGYLYYQIKQLQNRFRATLGGSDNTDSLEHTIASYFDKLNATQENLQQIRNSYQHLSKIASIALQKTAIVRFNPFQDTGGNQSFVLAMLDNHDSGFILTSIHSREGTRTYIKPISYGDSDYNLSQEETKALNRAQQQQPKGE